MLTRLRHKFPKVHMVGIGGVGMSGIAEILLANGFTVTGSDLTASEVTCRLSELGANIYIGHKAEQVGEASCIVYSSAIKPNNVELQEARRRKIPLISRAEMLAELMRMKTSIAVSGTHGKTTTTSLIATLLNSKPHLQPTAIIGGRLRSGRSGVIQGEGEILVAEADEFDQSFLKLHPTYVVITNIDNDHLECYGSFEELKRAFLQFTSNVPFWGKVIICMEDESLQDLIPLINRPLITYGLSPQADIQATDIQFNNRTTQFTLRVNSPGLFPDVTLINPPLYPISLNLPGIHNVLNSLAAVAVGLEFGISVETCQNVLDHFGGVERRFEILGEKRNILVVDDYAHHPTEVSSTIIAAKKGYHRRIVAVFQPHLFSRTQALHHDFARALLHAEVAIILPIYPSREDPIDGVTSQLIVDDAIFIGHKAIRLTESFDDAQKVILDSVQAGDLLLIMGAGDVRRLAIKILEEL